MLELHPAPRPAAHPGPWSRDRRGQRPHPGPLHGTRDALRSQTDWHEPLRFGAVGHRAGPGSSRFWVAGTETTASLLAWSLHLLGQHPEAARRMQTEVDAVLDGRVARHT
ncbi:MAG TPA: cytochrome P450, partial [Pseudonocardiaceae bacterium]